jgi:hypothetical protein
MKNSGLLVSAIVIAWWQFAGNGVARATREIPRVWDEAALADWATPIAGLNVRPTNMSTKDYYAMAVENLRTYPVYFPGREPDGYREMLQRVGPQPLIEPEKLTTEADWTKAGQRVFDEADHLHFAVSRRDTDHQSQECSVLQGRRTVGGRHRTLHAMGSDEEWRRPRIFELQQLPCAATAG